MLTYMPDIYIGLIKQRLKKLNLLPHTKLENIPDLAPDEPPYISLKIEGGSPLKYEEFVELKDFAESQGLDFEELVDIYEISKSWEGGKISIYYYCFSNRKK